ncbi:MAG: hypothetical protein KFF73_06410 [Cyclobacteriaceae bacterium]|nr:hypothetical protein [Cyclobacteriaceae bacterium]
MKRNTIILLLFWIPGLAAGSGNFIPGNTGLTWENEMNLRPGDDDMITLSDNHDHSGGYGGIFFKGTSFKDQTLLITGLRGAWVVNRSFCLGIDLNGILPTTKYSGVDPVGLDQAILTGGYGGILLEPIVWSNKIVHLTFPISIGAGWLGYVEDWENNQYYYDGDLFDDDVFWYFEPGINVEINVARFFRAGVGISK